MKFSIRDLLLVTVIMALATGWGLDRFRLKKECHQLNQRLDKCQQTVLDLSDPDATYYRLEFSEVVPIGKPSTSSAPAPIPPKK